MNLPLPLASRRRRSSFLGLLAIALVALSPAADANPIRWTDAFYLRIDNGYYVVDPDVFGTAVLVPTSPGFAFEAWTSAQNCRRAEGASPTTGSPWMHGSNRGSEFLRLKADRVVLSRIERIWMVNVDTMTGDIVCDGQIPQPRPVSIFLGGFE